MRLSHRPVTVLVLVLAGCMLVPQHLSAQTPKPQPDPGNYTEWIKQEVTRAIAAKAAEKAIAENGNGVANQKESSSVDTTSGSLVDTSSASDFASLALNLTGLDPPKEGDSKPKSGSATVTLYSLLAAAKGKALTDPAFYKDRTNWRRISATIGSEQSKLADHFTDKPSTNLGVKLLLVNSRDIYSTNGKNNLDLAQLAVHDFQVVEFAVRNEMDRLICRAIQKVDCSDATAFAKFLGTNPFDTQGWPLTLAALEKDPDAVEMVQEGIQRLAGARIAATKKITEAVDKIRKGRQLSVAYFTKQREDEGTDEHRAELIFDYGLSTRLNWTVNASFDYLDKRSTEDTRGGRAATEFQAKLSNPGGQIWTARPVTLSGSGEASKKTDTDWLLRAQLKLIVPLTTGVDVPIAYTYANRDVDGLTSGSQLKFSLAVDPVRLRERFR